jgi:hypothetical protein
MANAGVEYMAKAGSIPASPLGWESLADFVAIKAFS